MTRFRLTYLGPVVLISLCLIVLCAFTAASLLHQQAAITQVLRENVESRRAAVELEECVTDLIALENDSVEKVAVLHHRVRTLLAAVRGVADQPEEQDLNAQIDTGFADYLARWQAMPPQADPAHEAARQAATRLLETAVLKPCQEFKLYNARRIEASADHHERVLRNLAWGMTGIGGLGGVAGMFLGYAVARRLSRTIRRLQVQVRDAAGKLDPGVPEIVLTGEGEFRTLHDQLDQLTDRIEGVVQQLHQREREVLRAEQLAAVGQLAAGVAHEIRNPLTSIKLLVQAGQEDGGGLTAEDMRVIVGEIRRLERSLNTFLEFARPAPAEHKPVELLPVVHDVLGLVRGRADKQGVALTLDAPADVVTLTADAGQLQQVLVNLALNALDAMPTGGTLAVRVRRPQPGRVEIEVADTGPGIADAVVGRLFEPFVSTKDTGVGLGLVISRRIAADHGGTLGGYNRVGGGASFVITLPTAGGPLNGG